MVSGVGGVRKSRWFRAVEVIEQFYLLGAPEKYVALTVCQIAGLIGLKPSTYLREILYDLVDDGQLHMMVVDYRGVSKIKCKFELVEHTEC